VKHGEVVTSPLVESYQTRFDSAMMDDLNTPIALTILFEAIKDSNLSPAQKMALLKSFDAILGIDFAREFEVRRKSPIPEEIQKLIQSRDLARSQKQWSESDRIRNLLIEKGYKVEDSPTGTRATQA
jgi:cysteinyl-tRNA synthetase